MDCRIGKNSLGMLSGTTENQKQWEKDDEEVICEA